MRKKRISIILVVAMLLSLIPFSAATAEGEPDYSFDVSKGVTISDGTAPGTYKVTYGNPQIEVDNIPQSETITLFTKSFTSDGINVTATHGTLKLRFNGLNVGGGGYGMRLSAESNRNVEILLADNSINQISQSLSTKGGYLTISCEHAAEQGHICDEDCGTLKAFGSYGDNLAGIDGDNITINGGNIYAKGMASVPGIGKYRETVKNLTFNGGNIEAEGGEGTFATAGIGGGNWGDVNGIYIKGGRITATGKGTVNGQAIGIGAGENGKAKNITISGGTVIVNDYIYAKMAFSHIKITGGSILTQGIQVRPFNNAQNPVYRTTITLEGVSKVTHVTGISISNGGGYNKDNIFTDANGKIYLYLPKNATVTQVKTADNTYTGYVVTTADDQASAVFKGPAILTAGAVERTGETEATVKFTSNKAGRYYYTVDDYNYSDLRFVLSESDIGIACDTNEQTVYIDSTKLRSGVGYFYVVVEDNDRYLSDTLKIEIPAYVQPQPGTISFDVDIYQPDEGFDGRMIRVSRTGGSDGVVSVDYHMEDGTAKEGTHYTACTGRLEWPDGDSNDRKIWFIATDDNVYSGFRDLVCVLSNPGGGAELGERSRVLIQIRDNDNPPVPTGLRAVAGNGQVTLSWNPVQDAHYDLFYSTVDGNFTEYKWIESGVTTHTFTGLNNGTTYYYAIKASHSTNYSPMSESVSATPKAPAPPVVYEPPKYNVREAEQDEQIGGRAEFSKKRAEAGETVTFTSNPDIGYESGMPAVYDRNGNPVPVTDNGDGSFSFKMPAGGADVETTYNRIDYFDDVSEEDWFDEASWYCAAHGLMKGTGERQFDADRGTTRAMLVTVLYNLTNNPDDFESIFDDVEMGKWYSNPIAWAAQNKIVEGYGDGKFGPDDYLTREQIASILYSYTLFMEYDLGDSDSLDAFSDKESVSGWALEAMKWAVGNGILEAVENDLIAPKAGATRAELAEMMQRYVTRFVK